jgi:peptidyl-prolyl cis-trans isomerase SurA
MKNAQCKSFCMKSIPQVLRDAVTALVFIALIPAAVHAAVIDGIAIIVNDDAILVSEINEAMMPLIQEYRSAYAGAELQKKMAELRDTVIKQAIETKLILQLAETNGITASEKAVDNRIKAVQDRFPSEDEFLQALAAKGLTYREYRDQVAEQVLVQETMRRMIGIEEDVLDNEVREYYERHSEEFVTQARVKLAQIFLEIPSGATAEQIAELRARAEQIRAQIENGADFSELATNYSEGPYREKGGVIGVVSPREILPELEDTVFALETGEVSEVTQTSYGFHILKALEAMPERKISFEEAKPFIEERLNERKRNEKYQEWIEKLREDAFIDIKI